MDVGSIKGSLKLKLEVGSVNECFA